MQQDKYILLWLGLSLFILGLGILRFLFTKYLYNIDDLYNLKNIISRKELILILISIGLIIMGFIFYIIAFWVNR